ncbi:outer membrane porin protein 32 precursor [mine drainage metagenome]|uniref:Outer membrane porin protein 32 n=1 Tax=mine drainage metagenome TaxID=410659 RepID=A0A1J5RWV1_9ZZZZ
MQKKLIALAVAGLMSGGAFAASSVTVYGNIDMGLRNVTNVDAKGDSVLGMGATGSGANGTDNGKGDYAANRLGFTGKEDLGNGLDAHFNLEMGYLSGNGGLDNATNQIFQRQANVGLGGAWGSLDLGRNYTAIFKTVAAYDPFHYTFTGAVPLVGLDGLRRDNDIQYTGSFNGLTVRVEHALGQVPGMSGASATTEGGLSYGNGPINVGGAYRTQKDATNQLTSKQWTVGGAFKTGPFEVAAGYDKNTADQVAKSSGDTKNWWLGGSYAMTPAAALLAGYFDTKTTNLAAIDGQSKKFVVGAKYNMSKSTILYADIDHTNLDGSSVIGYGGAQTQDSQNGIMFGIDHWF